MKLGRIYVHYHSYKYNELHIEIFDEFITCIVQNIMSPR